jgi:hypothetical protein
VSTIEEAAGVKSSLPDPRADAHRRPAGVDDATVEAVGRLGEALEWLERARGNLYDLHQMMGRVDLLMAEAADQLQHAGHAVVADTVRREVVGRNILNGRWSFEVVEEFDDLYYEPVRAVEREARHGLVGGRRHLYEAEMKRRSANAQAMRRNRRAGFSQTIRRSCASLAPASQRAST